jgi:hypothetical protein
MTDTEERKRERERLVAYFIGTLVREHGINLSNQPGAMTRLHQFAEIGQEALEEDRLEALNVSDANIAMGLDGAPLPFHVNIDKVTLRAILDGKIPAPVDDDESKAARAKRLELARMRRDAEAEAKRRALEMHTREKEESAERDAAALRRFKTIMIVSLVAVVLGISAIVFWKQHEARDEHAHDKKSEGARY